MANNTCPKIEFSEIVSRAIYISSTLSNGLLPRGITYLKEKCVKTLQEELLLEGTEIQLKSILQIIDKLLKYTHRAHIRSIVADEAIKVENEYDSEEKTQCVNIDFFNGISIKILITQKGIEEDIGIFWEEHGNKFSIFHKDDQSCEQLLTRYNIEWDNKKTCITFCNNISVIEMYGHIYGIERNK